MMVTSDVRRPDPAESATDPVPYAYAPTSVTSFVRVLHEISGRSAEATEQRLDAEAPEKPAESTASNGPDASSEVERDNESHGDTQETRAAGDSERESNAVTDNADEEPAEDGVAEEQAVLAQDTDPADGSTAPLDSNAAEGGETTDTPATPSLNTTPVETSGGGREATAAHSAQSPVTTPPATTETAASAPESDNAAMDGAEVDTDPPAPPTPFPKTLNAMLAENALRSRTAEADTRPESAQTAVAALEAGEETADIPESPPPANPVPRAAAMELGGVRAETSSVPRIPLSNLPGELAQQVHLMQQEGTRTMRIRLVPENLGELRIEIQGAGDTMRVRMIAATPAARDALESQMGDLRQALQKQGLSLNNFSVDTGPDGREAPQQHEQPRHRNSGGANVPAPLPAPIEHDVTTTRPETVAGALNVLA